MNQPCCTDLPRDHFNGLTVRTLHFLEVIITSQMPDDCPLKPRAIAHFNHHLCLYVYSRRKRQQSYLRSRRRRFSRSRSRQSTGDKRYVEEPNHVKFYRKVTRPFASRRCWKRELKPPECSPRKPWLRTRLENTGSSPPRSETPSRTP